MRPRRVNAAPGPVECDARGRPPAPLMNAPATTPATVATPSTARGPEARA